MANRLAAETSPYLLQHADNPVDWYPWGEAAFAAARAGDKPIFLSVGYSSCHWCHVMAHESFEDDETAAFLNGHFVPVKVDREERPDVDAVFMEAVTAMTGTGGWPMSVFVTPDGRPFYGGTYWPREARGGMPGFTEVLRVVADAWRDHREEVVGSADQVTTALAERTRPAAAETLDLQVADQAAGFVLEQAWDRQRGGFGKAPKFPQAMTLEFLLDRHVRTAERAPLEAAVGSLDAMARGGIHDQVGGGFARYSTNVFWLVPHFEKMLYDNALLLATYAKAAAITGRDDLVRVARRTADYLLRDMRHADGGFFSATDADSEGVEGRFFTWDRDEFAEVVAAAGADPDLLADLLGVTAEGNWEGTNILHLPVPVEELARQHGQAPDDLAGQLDTVLDTLRERRATRVPPGLDDKVLTSWNALAIRGLARAGAYLSEPRYVDAAREAATFLADNLVVDGTLHHTFKDGRASVPAFLEDVALLAGALLDLWQVTGELRWYRWAVELAEDVVARFHDDQAGGYFQTPHDAPTDAPALYTRPKELWDNAQPAGNSVFAEVATKLAAFTGDATWQDRADEVLRLLQPQVARMPMGFGHLLQVVEFLLAGPREIAVVGAPGQARDALTDEVWRVPRAGTVVAVAAPDSPAVQVVPLLHARGEVDGRAAAYVCRNFTCERPVTEPDELSAALTRQ